MAQPAAIELAALSQRERDVMALIVTGLTGREIGAELGISNRTVDIHRAHAITKLGARNATHAAIIFERTSAGAQA